MYEHSLENTNTVTDWTVFQQHQSFTFHDINNVLVLTIDAPAYVCLDGFVLQFAQFCLPLHYSSHVYMDLARNMQVVIRLAKFYLISKRRNQQNELCLQIFTICMWMLCTKKDINKFLDGTKHYTLFYKSNKKGLCLSELSFGDFPLAFTVNLSTSV